MKLFCGGQRLSKYKLCANERGVLLMKTATAERAVWRVWVDTNNRIISFHEAEGFRPLEFYSHEMFLSCVDEYTGRHYRYQ